MYLIDYILKTRQHSSRKLYVLQFQLPPPDVQFQLKRYVPKWTAFGGRRGSAVLRSPMWGRGLVPRSDVQDGEVWSRIEGIPYHVTYPMMYLMLPNPPAPPPTDRRLWKHYLPQTSFLGGKYLHSIFFFLSHTNEPMSSILLHSSSFASDGLSLPRATRYSSENHNLSHLPTERLQSHFWSTYHVGLQILTWWVLCVNSNTSN